MLDYQVLNREYFKKIMTMEPISNKKQNIIFSIGILLIAIFLIWKAQYGLGGKDVSWYITIPYRAIHGDVLFWDEWNLAQLSSILFIPLTKLYLSIVGSSEAIMINSRYLYIVIDVLMAILFYIRIRYFGKWALLLAWIYSLYSPFNHNMISYNSISVMVAVLGIAVLATANKKRDYIYVGICYSLAAICQPLLAIIFILGVIIIIVASVCKKKKDSIKKVLITTTTCIVCSIPLFVYFIFETGVSRFLRILPYIKEDMALEGDASKVWADPIRRAFGALLPKNQINIYGMNINTVYLSLIIFGGLFVILFIYLISLLLKRNNVKFNSALVIIASALAALQSIIYSFATKTNPINIMWVSWLFVGILLIKGQKDKLIKRMYYFSIIWGIIHSFGYLTSNGGGAVFAVAWFPASIFSILMIKNNLLINKRIVKIAVGLFIGVNLISFIYVRGTAMFYDSNICNMNYKIAQGPARGIKVNKQDYDKYTSIKKEIDSLDTKNKRIMIISENVWTYLFTDSRLAQNSMYLKGINNKSVNILYNYRKSKNEKLPDLIIIPKDELTQIKLDEIIKKLRIKKYKIDNKRINYIIYPNNK